MSSPLSLRTEFESFIGAIRFFTRLTIPGLQGHDDVALRRAIRYFPITGLIVGGFAAVAFSLTILVFPKTLAIAIALAVAISLTGAIHEDGWNDMVDGFVGGKSKDEILSIMRESQVSNYGAVALVAMLLARLLTLVELDQSLIPAALIAGHAVSRVCATFVLGKLKYVRAEGKAKAFSKKLHDRELGFATLSALPPLFFLPFWHVIFGALFAGLTTRWLMRLFKRRIGGYTGDCLGATQQLAEIAFYGGLICHFS